jgi:hypothetical protein
MAVSFGNNYGLALGITAGVVAALVHRHVIMNRTYPLPPSYRG